jgi:hypothetical protein
MRRGSSSGTSSHRQASVESRRVVVPRSRKGKEVVRHAPLRPTAHRLGAARQSAAAAAAQRKAANVVESRQRPSFNIGSVSSHGSKARRSRSRQAASAVVPGPAVPSPPPPGPHAPSPSKPSTSTAVRQNSRVVMSSSDYETTDTEDSWASEEDIDTEENEQTRAETQLREAAREAQRQREMFTKVPQRSYSSLNQRTRSGLLSALLNPDPKIFPPNHPYRTSYSSQDIQAIRRSGVNRAPVGLQTSRSAAVLPLAAQMTAVTAQAPAPAPVTAGEPSSGGYRPRGQPQGQEMEESDSGEEDTIQISKSVAQQRLAALAGRRSSDRGPRAVRRSSDQGPSARSPLASAMPPPPTPPPPRRPVLTSVATAPIPFGHPYNLPAPAPPMTPRTTRRQMLSTELSESLRRNLLWERQVSKLNMMGGGRRQSSNASAGGRAGVTGAHNPGPHDDGPSKPSTSSKNNDDALAERKKAAMARNRSWAGDFHFAGW